MNLETRHRIDGKIVHKEYRGNTYNVISLPSPNYHKTKTVVHMPAEEAEMKNGKI